MHRDEIRERIAAEAARLMLRGKESDYAAARKRAARWLKRRRLHRDEIPSNQEIQVQMQALCGIQHQEQDPATLAQIYHWTGQLLACLQEFPALCDCGEAESRPVAGALTRILVRGDVAVIRERLAAAGYAPQSLPIDSHDLASPAHVTWRLRLRGQFPCEILGTFDDLENHPSEWLNREQLQSRIDQQPIGEFSLTDIEPPDAFAIFELLLEPLSRVVWPSSSHPEGDALYHSLQVFELGREARPYDEEFLLACLLHDVGHAINPKHPILSAIDALGMLITDRTRFLIEQRPVATQYLQTGECPKSLRRSEDFEDVLLLARLDRAGRVPGATVCTLEEAFSYIAELDSAWDDD